MKKRLILTSILLLAGAVTTSLWMKNASVTSNLLTANVEALSGGESGGVCGPGYADDSILAEDPNVKTDNRRCVKDGILIYSKGTLYNSQYRKGMTYTVSYKEVICQISYGSCCDESQRRYTIINDGLKNY